MGSTWPFRSFNSVAEGPLLVGSDLRRGLSEAKTTNQAGGEYLFVTSNNYSTPGGCRGGWGQESNLYEPIDMESHTGFKL